MGHDLINDWLYSVRAIKRALNRTLSDSRLASKREEENSVNRTLPDDRILKLQALSDMLTNDRDLGFATVSDSVNIRKLLEQEDFKAFIKDLTQEEYRYSHPHSGDFNEDLGQVLNDSDKLERMARETQEAIDNSVMASQVLGSSTGSILVLPLAESDDESVQTLREAYIIEPDMEDRLLLLTHEGTDEKIFSENIALTIAWAMSVVSSNSASNEDLFDAVKTLQGDLVDLWKQVYHCPNQKAPKSSAEAEKLRFKSPMLGIPLEGGDVKKGKMYLFFPDEERPLSVIAKNQLPKDSSPTSTSSDDSSSDPLPFAIPFVASLNSRLTDECVVDFVKTLQSAVDKLSVVLDSKLVEEQLWVEMDFILDTMHELSTNDDQSVPTAAEVNVTSPSIGEKRTFETFLGDDSVNSTVPFAEQGPFKKTANR